MKNLTHIICFVIITLLMLSCNKQSTDPTDLTNPELEVIPRWDGLTKIEPETDASGAYLIATAENLAWFDEKTVTQNIKFVNSIDMNNKPFVGIGKYSGTIEGNNKVIKNIMIKSLGDNVGLINQTSGEVVIQNLGLEGGSIKGKNKVAGFIGEVTKAVKIYNSYNATTITSIHSSGGLIGDINNAETVTIENSYNEGMITSTGYASTSGGLIGYISYSKTITIENSYNTGDISSFSYSSGGLIGYLNNTKTVTIENSYNEGMITSAESSSGGLIGLISSSKIVTIKNSYNIGSLNAGVAAGGIFGKVYSDSKINVSTSFSYGDSYDSLVGESIDGIIGIGSITGVNNYWYYLDRNVINNDNGSEALTLEEFTDSSKFSDWNFSTIWNDPKDTGKPYPTLRNVASAR